MNNMVAKSRKVKSVDSVKANRREGTATKSATITNGVKATAKKSEKNVAGKLVHSVKQTVLSRKKKAVAEASELNNIEDKDSATLESTESKDIASVKKIQETKLQSDSEIIDSSDSSKNVPSSRKRKTALVKSDPILVQISQISENDQEIGKSTTKAGKKAKSAKKAVAEDDVADFEEIAGSSNSTSALDVKKLAAIPEESPNVLITDELDNENSDQAADVEKSSSLKRVPSSRKRKTLDVTEASSTLKRVPSTRRRKTAGANELNNIVEDENEESDSTKKSSKLDVETVSKSVDSQEPTTLKGISSPRKRKTPAKEKVTKSKQSTVDVVEPSTSQKSAPVHTAKRQKVLELPIPTINSTSGTVFVIGQNDVGQLGLSDDVEQRTRPFQLDLPYSIVDVAAGGMHSVCLTANGEVITFGCNDESALGRVTNDESPEYLPKKVDIPERIVQISAADSHTAALSESGQVYIWGNFRSGDGAMGLTRNGLIQSKPLKILTKEKVVMISSGSEHLVCLSANGAVYSCGAGENGQLGRLSSRSALKGGRLGLANLVEPAQLHVTKSGKPILMDKVWTGAYNTFLREQGTGSIYACGLNNFSHLGFTSEEAVYMPKKIDSFENNVWQHIHGGMHHTIALDNSGKVYSIGRKEYGRLGLGENCDDTDKPTIIPTIEEQKCTDVSCGNVTSFAVTEEGSAYSWGFGDNYQLGHGKDEDCLVPTLVGGKFHESWKAIRISGGGQHALILACNKEKSDAKK